MKKIKITKNGKTRKLTKNNNSKSSKNNRTKKSKNIRKLLVAIPIPMENPTRPCLYSFLRGLKNVFIIAGSDKRLTK